MPFWSHRAPDTGTPSPGRRPPVSHKMTPFQGVCSLVHVPSVPPLFTSLISPTGSWRHPQGDVDHDVTQRSLHNLPTFSSTTGKFSFSRSQLSESSGFHGAFHRSIRVEFVVLRFTRLQFVVLRLHAQALTLAALGGAALVEYYISFVVFGFFAQVVSLSVRDYQV